MAAIRPNTVVKSATLIPPATNEGPPYLPAASILSKAPNHTDYRSHETKHWCK